jgi:hypothetical protein
MGGAHTEHPLAAWPVATAVAIASAPVWNGPSQEPATARMPRSCRPCPSLQKAQPARWTFANVWTRLSYTQNPVPGGGLRSSFVRAVMVMAASGSMCRCSRRTPAYKQSRVSNPPTGCPGVERAAYLRWVRAQIHPSVRAMSGVLLTDDLGRLAAPTID